jgi:hypothetical protein
LYSPHSRPTPSPRLLLLLPSVVLSPHASLPCSSGDGVGRRHPRVGAGARRPPSSRAGIHELEFDSPGAGAATVGRSSSGPRLLCSLALLGFSSGESRQGQGRRRIGRRTPRGHRISRRSPRRRRIRR